MLNVGNSDTVDGNYDEVHIDDSNADDVLGQMLNVDNGDAVDGDADEVDVDDGNGDDVER